MSEVPQGPGWWQASDHKWYPPERHPNYVAQRPPPMPPSAPQPGYGTPSLQSGYGAPSSQPGYGAFPPPGYGPPAEPVVSIGAAFNYAMSKFQTNAREILIAGVICVLGLIVLVVTSYLIVMVGLMGAAENKGGALLFFVGLPLLWLIPAIGVALFQMVIIRGSLMIVNGQTPLTLQRMFSIEQVGSYLLGAVIVAVGTTIGYMLCFIPGLLFFFFSAYWGYFLIGKQLSPVDAIKASFGFVNRHLGSLLLLFLASVLLYILGSLVLFFGLIVAVPIIVIAQAFMWRRLQGEPVAP
jgi:uncharacterized membrane protein